MMRMVARVIGTIRGGAVAVAPAIPVADSIREETDDGRLVIVDRERLRAVQTPQGFDLDVLEASHDYADEQQIACTDDISVCEAAGHPVRLVKGAMTSLKITSATDLDLAHAFLKLRAGFGRHSFRRVLRHRPFAWVVKPAEPAPVAAIASQAPRSDHSKSTSSTLSSTIVQNVPDGLWSNGFCLMSATRPENGAWRTVPAIS